MLLQHEVFRGRFDFYHSNQKDGNEKQIMLLNCRFRCSMFMMITSQLLLLMFINLTIIYVVTRIKGRKERNWCHKMLQTYYLRLQFYFNWLKASISCENIKKIHKVWKRVIIFPYERDASPSIWHQYKNIYLLRCWMMFVTFPRLIFE